MELSRGVRAQLAFGLSLFWLKEINKKLRFHALFRLACSPMSGLSFVGIGAL